ncbi:MAG: hypothetical protein BWY63_01042 [Chloroflexi bacterium ADurb.Bin360]|nr:MAG: hypothetical protein BWY63_01042 [Chloroflexi bacterium ADurb.Bin360]
MFTEGAVCGWSSKTGPLGCTPSKWLSWTQSTSSIGEEKRAARSVASKAWTRPGTRGCTSATAVRPADVTSISKSCVA